MTDVDLKCPSQDEVRRRIEVAIKDSSTAERERQLAALATGGIYPLIEALHSSRMSLLASMQPLDAVNDPVVRTAMAEAINGLPPGTDGDGKTMYQLLEAFLEHLANHGVSLIGGNSLPDSDVAGD